MVWAATFGIGGDAVVKACRLMPLMTLFGGSARMETTADSIVTMVRIVDRC